MQRVIKIETVKLRSLFNKEENRCSDLHNHGNSDPALPNWTSSCSPTEVQNTLYQDEHIDVLFFDE